jgi:hypothetical protein
MKRHIGKIINTDHRCVVCYMQIPGREDHALVVQVESLPPRFEQAVMEIVDSNEAQSEPVLANVLSRHLMSDLNKSVFQALHETGLLRAVHIDQVVMLPQPNMPFPLRQIIEQMGSTLPPQTTAPTPPVQKYNQYNENMGQDGTERNRAIANNLLIEADLLQRDVDRKREEAFKLSPDLVNQHTAQREARMAPKATPKAAKATAEVKTTVTKKAPVKRATAKKTDS